MAFIVLSSNSSSHTPDKRTGCQAAYGNTGGKSWAQNRDPQIRSAPRAYKQVHTTYETCKSRSYRLAHRRLVELREERRLAAQAHMAAQHQRKRAALLVLFEEVDGGSFGPTTCYRCKAHTMAGGTPCGKLLRTRAGSYVAILVKHLLCYHAVEYSAFKMAMDALL